MLRTVDVLLNAGSGSTADETAGEIISQFKQHGIEARIHELREGDDIKKVVRDAVEANGDALIACGGDGTVNALAAAAIENERPLGILPLGTLNNFSKDLGIPQELSEAVDLVATANSVRVDAAEVNGQFFVNNSSIGLYPRIVRDREKQQQRLGRGKWFAAFWAAVKVLRSSNFLNVKLDVDGKTLQRKTPFVFVGNNTYEMDLYNIGRRERLDEGCLSIYLLRRGGAWGVIVMLLKTLTGTVRQWKDFEEFRASELTIVSKRGSLLVAFDGEVSAMETPLEYKIHPRVLKVFVPVAEKE